MAASAVCVQNEYRSWMSLDQAASWHQFLWPQRATTTWSAIEQKCSCSCSCCPLQLARNTQTPAATRTNGLQITQPEKNKLNKQLGTGETPPTKGSQSGARFVCVLTLFRKIPLLWKHNCSIFLEEQTRQCPSLKDKMEKRKIHNYSGYCQYNSHLFLSFLYLRQTFISFFLISANTDRKRKTYQLVLPLFFTWVKLFLWPLQRFIRQWVPENN